jgi:OpgC protein
VFSAASPVLVGLAATASLGTSTILGSRIVKVEPRPGSLSTVMSPPIIWQKRLLIASPRPVPPYNPFAWQLLFVFGAWCALGEPSAFPPCWSHAPLWSLPQRISSSRF